MSALVGALYLRRQFLLKTIQTFLEKNKRFGFFE